MTGIFNIIMLILEGALGLGSIALAFLERGFLPKLLYLLSGLLMLPILPLRRKIESRYHLKSFVIPAIAFILIIIAVFITPIH